ncbi:MAG: hypothetical protein WCI57_00680 [Candidatus Berkelbacteria bacterium]
MNHPALITKSTLLATKNKIGDKELACEKIVSKNSANNFLFYLIELDKPYPNSKIVNKIIQIVKNRAKTTSGDITDQDFDRLLSALNEGVSRVAEAGERQWIGHLNAVVGMISDKEIIISYSGNVVGYIFRKNKISAITNKEIETSTNPIKTFTDVTSGKLAEDDQFVFANTSLFQHIPLDRLRDLLKEPSATEALALLNRLLKKRKVADVNAIILESRDPLFSDLNAEDADYIFLDEPEETTLQIIRKTIKPIYEKCTKTATPVLKKCWKTTKKWSALFAKNWEEKYSKDISRGLGKFSESVSRGAQKTKLMIEPELEKLKEHPHYQKVKINSTYYSKSKQSAVLSSTVNVVTAIYQNIAQLFKKENRKFLYIILMLIVLCVAYNKIKENNTNRKEVLSKTQVDTSYDRAERLYNDASNDLKLGKTDTSNKFSEAQSLATTALSSEKDREKASALLRKINDVIDETIKAKRFYVAEPALLEASVKKIAITGTMIYGFADEGKLFMVDMRDKEAKLVTVLNKEYGIPQTLYYSTFENKFFLETNLNQMFKFDPSSKAFEGLAVVDDGQKWENGKTLSTYSSNVYVLDTDQGEVWKHVVREGGYAKGTKYVDTKKVNLKNAVDFAVDGNIYTLMNDGSILKFVKGSLEQDFATRDIPAPNNKITDPTKLYTDEDTANIFVLDKGNNRILKFDKSGNFLNQYLFDGVTIEDFAVNPKIQKIWALSAGKIYEGNL